MYLISNKPIPFSKLFYVILTLPAIVSTCPVSAKKRHLAYIESILMKKAEAIRTSDCELIRTHQAEMNKFFEQLSNLMDIKHSPTEKEALLRYFRASFMEGEENISPHISLNNGSIDKKSNTQLIKEIQTPNISMEKTKIIIKEEVEQVLKEYSNALYSKWKENKVEHKAIDSVPMYSPHGGCDFQELCILSAVENYLAQGQHEEAMRLLKWRKNLLSIAQNCGWAVAKKISIITSATLKISHLDFIMASIDLMDEDKKDTKNENQIKLDDKFFDEPVDISCLPTSINKKTKLVEKYSGGFTDCLQNLKKFPTHTPNNAAPMNSSSNKKFLFDLQNDSNQQKDKPEKSNELKLLIDKAAGIQNLSKQMDNYLKLRPSSKNLRVLFEKI